MTENLNRDRVRALLRDSNLNTLFIDELGWDRGGEDIEVTVAGQNYGLHAVAHKRGLVVYFHQARSDDAFPDYPTRQKIERAVAKQVREHLIVFVDPDRNAQYWQWVKREQGQPDRFREHIRYRDQSGEGLIQKLEHLHYALEEEEAAGIIEAAGRVRAAFDVERVTKRFYERFKKEHEAFLTFIEGIQSLADREWYASLMLNRMMFVYFIQKRGFLDGDSDYLRDRLRRMQQQQGGGRFHRFYRLFLLHLFHEGLGQPEAQRSPELAELLGEVPYLNGGLFDVHDLERDNADIEIPDEAFQRIFEFFDAYQWHLDDRALRKDTEINPDVLGYIFEKYINQKQMGAYYTKEDITGYIGRNTIIPFLFDAAKKDCPIAFKPGGGVWRLLQDDPDRYFYDAVRHGITYDINGKRELPEKLELPAEIAAGVDTVARRAGWNKPAPAEFALPTEIWREHVARRQRYEEIRAKLAAGEVNSINDLITYNLDIEKFAWDVIGQSEGPELVRAFWKALNKVSVLDPTCGSGAFLFAALNILEPLYVACLEAMRGFLDDLERSGRKHHPETMKDFRKVIARLDEHASESYFVLKSIVIGNLYGVDIMEEAVEICKLRLFLKLVAQLESYDQIEPLPDIDFNIRAGNTLVGFVSLDEVKQALSDDLVKQLSLPDIEERAEIADRAFRQFRAMQIEHGMDAQAFSAAKAELRERLNELRTELDRYLAGEYGIDLEKPKQFEKWHDSHQPFHWFVEFYGIMHNGGFGVIIGNPPYVAYPGKNVNYRLQETNYHTIPTKNLYALVYERSVALAQSKSPVCLIVQLTSLSSGKLPSLQQILLNRGALYALAFPRRPKSVFEAVEMPVSILLSLSSDHQRLFTTGICRFYSEEKFICIDRVSLCEHSIVTSGHRIAKFGTVTDKGIHKKISAFAARVGDLDADQGDHRFVYYQEACRYWAKATNKRPFFKKNGKHITPSHWRTVRLYSSEAAAFVACILNSSLFYWYYSAFSDCEHINDGLVQGFPIPENWNAEGGDWERLACGVVTSLENSSVRKKIVTKQGHEIEYDEISAASSKEQIDEMEAVLARTYDLNDKELDYVKAYDIKYRMGLSSIDETVE